MRTRHGPPPQPGPPPAVTVADLTEPATSGEALEIADQDLVKLASPGLRARRVIVRLEGGTVVYHRTSVRVRTRTTMSPGLVGYGTCGPRRKGSSVNGVPLRPGSMWAAEAGAEVAFVVNPGFESVSAAFTPDEMQAHFQGRQREANLAMPKGAEILQRDPAAVRRFFTWGKRLVTTAERRPELFNDRRDTRVAAEAELLEALIGALSATTGSRLPRRDDTRRAQSRIVKDAEECALAHMGARLYVTDLCTAAGVSERSLEYAFKGIMGMTPVAYLTRVRLHRVRQALLAATSGSTTVSVEALNGGFWHFGEFSRAYRDCFGELPSETLRRAVAADRT
ncbi:MAG: helix-turn-helix domain-containing protein [Vicinamibacterales bacterium]|nr:helix-turn-helix domain-containing protein [Vicinamibacterales bacterium]